MIKARCEVLEIRKPFFSYCNFNGQSKLGLIIQNCVIKVIHCKILAKIKENGEDNKNRIIKAMYEVLEIRKHFASMV